MLARLKDGVLTDLGTGPRGSAEWPDSERVEIDEVAPHPPGARLVLDPKNPRRAIVAPPTYAELRRAEYDRRGVTAEAMIVALWERIVEGRPAASDALQAARTAVKAAYPKPRLLEAGDEPA